MAGYGYATKGYTTYNETEPTYNGYVCNEDHVCRPVIVDAEGRTRPVINYTDSSGYVKKTPEYTSYRVERVHTPDYTSYDNYGTVNDDKWRRQSNSPPRKFNEFVTKVHTEATTHYPTKTTNTNHWQTATPTYTYGHPLTTTTNDIGEAIDFLKHAVNEAPPQHAQSRGQTRESYGAETMDSRDATKRYARPVFKQQPSHEAYVDRRGAVHKYSGMI